MGRWGRAVVLAVGVGILATACAAGGNDAAGTADAAGFWLGLWHGIIAPITFLVSLFTEDVGIYEIRNTGGWYDFGFLLGVSVVFSGSARAGSTATRRPAGRAGRGSG